MKSLMKLQSTGWFNCWQPSEKEKKFTAKEINKHAGSKFFLIKTLYQSHEYNCGC